MTNPYEYLGLNRNATEQQVMDAYRSIAASIQNSSGTDEEKASRMNELNEAYDYVLNEIRGTGAYYNNSNSSYNQSTSQFFDVRQRINSGRIDDAETILDGIPNNMRSAEWHYLKGMIHQRRGWLNEAYCCYQTACRMEPSNSEYAAAFNSMNTNANGGYRTSRHSSDCDTCDICQGLICADCCCECMGGDLIPCC